MEQARAVWVAEVGGRGALVRLIRAALLHGVAPVDLPDTHLAAGVHILQIRLRGQPVVVLSAEVAGETATGSYALRLMPLDPSHVPELIAITESDDEELPTSGGPMSTTASAIFDSEPPLPPGAALPPKLDPRAPTETLPDGDEDELGASVLFDPEAALISRAPPRPEGTSPDDTLTIPVRPSMMPAGMGEVPATERQDASLSITVDFDTSQSNVHTERFRPEWNAEEGAAAADPSLGESVVFDPDVLAREQNTAGPKPSRPPGVVIAPDEDLSLTPTAPMELPVRRPPSSRPAMSADGGPRTMRRNTGAHGIVIVGRVIANRYRIESLVGTGAIGAVYKASHVDLPRTYAIKVLHPHFRADAQLLASFRTEARAASLLDHPNVTVVHDFGEEPDGLVYIVMEYLAGVNLQAVLDEERRIEPQRAVAIMAQVCGALSAAHERGIVHRDVKPDNIMLVPSRDDEGRPFEMVKVCDFGIAALETCEVKGAASGEWTAGTPEYMAPEQAQGRADARTDIYACGILLYEMVTGRPPFVGDSPAATLAKHMTELPRRPSEIVPGLRPALEAVILCAIEKSPARRFASMRDFRVELKRLL